MKRYTLEDIKSEEEIDGLTVRQMKEVLVNNFVDYKGCVEKSELHLRVTRLWKEHQVNKQKTQEIISASDSAPSNVASRRMSCARSVWTQQLTVSFWSVATW